MFFLVSSLAQVEKHQKTVLTGSASVSV